LFNKEPWKTCATDHAILDKVTEDAQNHKKAFRESGGQLKQRQDDDKIDILACSQELVFIQYYSIQLNIRCMWS